MFRCLCVSICKYEDGRVSGRKAANVSLPPQGRVMSEPDHTDARRRERERESERLNLLSQDHQPELGDGRACGEGWHGWCTGMVGFHKCVDSMSCL